MSEPENISEPGAVPNRVSPHAYLGGLSPQEKSAENLRLVTTHLLEFGVTTSPLIQLLLDKLGRDWPSWAVKKGYLRKIKPPSGYPSVIYTLAPDGLNHALRHSDVELQYPELDLRKINYSTLRHSIYTQELCLLHNQQHGLRYIRGPRRYPEGYELQKKVPDAIIFYDDRGRIAIEAELHGKWDRDFDDFRLKVLKALLPMTNGKRRFDYFIIASDSLAIIERYKVGFKTDVAIPDWTKFNGKWVRSDENARKIPEELSKRVYFEHRDFTKNPTKPIGRKSILASE